MSNKIKVKTKRALIGYLFFSPWLIGFIVFTAYPFFYSLYLSFFKVRFTVSGVESTFVGLEFYKYAFRGDLTFPINFTNTIINIVLSTPLIVIFALIVSILLNNKIKLRAFFRLLYFLPVVIISGPVVSELVANNASKIVDPGKYFIYQFFTTLPDRISFPFLYMFDNLVLILWFS
ncbi:MAG TPA: sugar ABC transporter permease, partial [Thermosipho africanus]|nr:sugar ABC transporter permease [Thermosipho africanus]